MSRKNRSPAVYAAIDESAALGVLEMFEQRWDLFTIFYTISITSLLICPTFQDKIILSKFQKTICLVLQ